MTAEAAAVDHDVARLLAVVQGLVDETRPAGSAPVRVSLGSRIDRDLGLDSLARVELGLRIEQACGYRLDEDALIGAECVRDLLAPATAVAKARLPGHEREHVAPAAPDEAIGEPADATTLLDVLAWHVAAHPDRRNITFLASDDEVQEMSYGELDRRARRVAAALVDAGIAPGHACALMLPSCLEFFVVYYGILMAGGVPVPIYPPFRMSQIEDHLRRQATILANCEARILITVPEARLVARLAGGDVPTLQRVTTPADLERHPRSMEPRPATPEDIAFIQYTSGSTGNPKGVVLTHANLLANMRAMARAAQATSRDIFVSWLPLYHDMGLIGAWLTTHYAAVHLVLMSPVAFLARPSRWLWAIHRYRGTLSAAPNFAYEICASRLDARELEGLDLSSWRWAFNGAEAVSADTLERFAARYASYGLDPLTLAPVYGLAEVALDLVFPATRRGVKLDIIDRDVLMHTGQAMPVAPDHPHAQKMVANGRVLPGYALRIADPKGSALPERSEGRVQFRGPSATRGYYRNPEATAALFDGDWLDTGDLGYVADGELYITGRSKDMIIRGGHNIYPYELELAVGDLAGVRKGCVAVFGARAPGGSTERVVVLAETREADPAARERLRAEVNRLAVELIGGPADEVVLAPPYTVLKTSSGKIRRSATRDVYRNGLVGAARHAVWWQVVRLATHGLAARGRRLWAGLVRRLRAVWAWDVLMLAAPVAVLLLAVLPTLHARRAAMRRLARTVARLCGVSLTVEGLEHLPGDGAYSLVANHASYLDGIVLTAAMPADIAFVAKAELRASWAMRVLLEAIGTRFVERFDAARGVEDTRALADATRAGELLVYFPEGTFVREPGLLAFRMGAFVVSAQHGIPVVPVAIAGTRAALPPDEWMLQPGPVRVVVGKPVVPDGTDWSAAVRLRDSARRHIAAHCGEPDLAHAEVATVLRPTSPPTSNGT